MLSCLQCAGFILGGDSKKGDILGGSLDLAQRRSDLRQRLFLGIVH